MKTNNVFLPKFSKPINKVMNRLCGNYSASIVSISVNDYYCSMVLTVELDNGVIIYFETDYCNLSPNGVITVDDDRFFDIVDVDTLNLIKKQSKKLSKHGFFK